MKKGDLFQFAMMVCSISEIFLHAQQKKNVPSIDPIVDFRAPCSLVEMLQDGLNSVHASLQANFYSKTILQSVQNELTTLSLTYDELINTTRNNQVHNDDKTFLQSMIDRIDKLIAELEGDSNQVVENDDEQKEMLQSVRAMCSSLSDKISA